MPFRTRCTPNDIPFFRIIVSFCSMLTINRYCHAQKILNLIRSHFCLLKSFLPIILHEVTKDEEIVLDDGITLSKPINNGLYLAFLKYNEMQYQPLVDLKLVPIELFPEKIFLPKSMPFITFEIEPFVRTLNNMINYMKDYEKSKCIFRIQPNLKNDLNNYSPLRSFSQLSTSKRMYFNEIDSIICITIVCSENSYIILEQTKMTNIESSSSTMSPDFISVPLSRSTIISTFNNHIIDVRKYLVTSPLDNNSLPFIFRMINRKEQMIYQQGLGGYVDFSSNQNFYS